MLDTKLLMADVLAGPEKVYPKLDAQSLNWADWVIIADC